MQKRLVPCSTTTTKGGVCGEKRPGLVLVVVARWHELRDREGRQGSLCAVGTRQAGHTDRKGQVNCMPCLGCSPRLGLFRENRPNVVPTGLDIGRLTGKGTYTKYLYRR